MNGYIAFYNGKREEIYAETQLAAKEEAVKRFKAPKSKQHMISVWIAEKDVDPETGKGTEVIHVADF